MRRAPFPPGFSAPFGAMKMIRVLSLAGLVLFMAFPAQAGSHAIAMHGNPKQGPGFTQFDYVNPGAPKGGALVLSRTGSFDSLNPFIIKGVPAAGLDLVFERLLKRGRDEPFTLYGRVAKSVTVPEDRSWVVFTLREQARFQDGTPITADDIIFSVNTLRAKGRPNHRLYYKQVVRTEKLGPRQVKLVFKDASNRELPMIMGLMPILSKAYYGKVDFEKSSLLRPLGSGPYKIDKVDPGRSITYRRDPDYWGRDLPVNKGQYNFDTISFEYYRDGVVALEAFKAGLVDMRRETDPGRWATGYGSPALKAGRIVLDEIANGRPAGMYGLVFNTRRAIFSDRRVRAALAAALDFDWMNRTLYRGAYARTSSYFEGSELAADAPPTAAETALLEPFRAALPPEVFTKAYVAPGAKGRQGLRDALNGLKAAGWRFDGKTMVTGDARPVAFEILLVNPRDERLALEYRRRLGRLGISVSVRTVDTAQYQSRLNTYDFDMIVYLWDPSLSPGNEQAFYWGSKAALEEGTRNYPGIQDPAIDAMIKRLVDARERQDLVDATRALDRVLLWGHYVVPLFHLEKDRLAYWDRFGKPKTVPLYGYQLDAWWEDAAKAARLGRE